MRRVFKVILWIVAILIALPVLAVLALDIALNTGAGRNFATHEINALSGGTVRITGLAGHFPKYIAARRIAIADRKGRYLVIDDAVLRWSPFSLLHRMIDISDLTAKRIDILRQPVPAAAKPKPKPSAASGIPKVALVLGHLEIGRLAIAKPVLGHALALKITGHARAKSLETIAAEIDATSLAGPGTYRLAATLDANRVNAHLTVHEPPGGPIAAFAGIASQPDLAKKPVDLSLTIAGPRDHAALRFASALGDLKARGTGTVDLSQTAPGGDLTITIPELAPYAALGKQTLGGRTVLHVVAKHQRGATTLHFDDTVEITKATKPVPVLVGKRAMLAGDFTLAGGKTTIHSLTLDMAALKVKLAGTATRLHVALKGTLIQPDIGLVDPQLAGHVTENLAIDGPTDNLALHGTVDGLVTAKGVKSGPFHVTIDATHLPGAPQGNLTGTGSLYDSPLSLSAAFARSAAGAVDLDLKTLSWKSLRGQGRITRAPGAMLPDGAMHLAMARLADLAPLLHMKLAGAFTADFTHKSGQPAAIALTASHLTDGRTASLRAARIDATIDHLAQTPAIDATATLTGVDTKAAAGNLTLTAKGSETALAVTAAGRFARLAGKPAQLDLGAMLDGKTRTIRLAKLDAAARGVTARLLGPATISAGTTTSIRHLALALGGLGGAARITADGTIRPSLDLAAKITNLPAGIARAADPKLAATGLLDATAHLTGTLAAPTGTIALQGRGLGLATGPGAKLPRATLAARETLLGHALRGTIAATLGSARLSLDGTAPLALTGPMDLSFRLDNLSASLLHAADPKLAASGIITARARLTGTPRAPRGTVDLAAKSMRLLTGPASSLPPADLTVHETLLGQSVRGTARLALGNRADLTLAGTAPLSAAGKIDLALNGRTDLRLVDPLTAAGGTVVGGILTPDLRVTGTLAAPGAAGTLTLAGGRVQNIASGLDLSAIDATITAAGRTIRLDRLSAKAGVGTIDGSGTFGLAKPMPVDLRIAFHHASPIASDILTERLGGALSLTGDIDTGTRLAGTIAIETANIQIPQGLPPSVVKLDIRRKGARPPPPAAPAPPVALDLTVDARNEVFVRGKGLFANLGGRLHVGGTLASPQPTGGFHLIRGYFNLGGQTLNLSRGTVRFNGNGVMPVIDLEVSGTASDGTVSTLALTGEASAPKITLSSSPSLPSDEVLAHLLYGSSTQNLSALQAASLAASLAELAGIGGGGPDVVGGLRSALGLDQLSIGGGTSAPTINAGRYVAPGVYVGAQQSATGGGTGAKVEINLYKGLKLKTEVQSNSGTGGTTGPGESVGLTYQFDY